MIHKKDEFFNWYTPSNDHKRGRLGNVIRVHNTKKRRSVVIGRGLIEEIFGEEIPSVKVAFDFSPENPFCVFDPKPGVPFIIFSTGNGNAKSPFYNSTDLVDKFRKTFDLSKRCAYYDFELKEMQKLSGMTLYSITKVNEVPCEENE